jgi:hypothetical protein
VDPVRYDRYLPGVHYFESGEQARARLVRVKERILEAKYWEEGGAGEYGNVLVVHTIRGVLGECLGYATFKYAD